MNIKPVSFEKPWLRRCGAHGPLSPANQWRMSSALSAALSPGMCLWITITASSKEPLQFVLEYTKSAILVTDLHTGMAHHPLLKSIFSVSTTSPGEQTAAAPQGRVLLQQSGAVRRQTQRAESCKSWSRSWSPCFLAYFRKAISSVDLWLHASQTQVWQLWLSQQQQLFKIYQQQSGAHSQIFQPLNLIMH